MRIAFYSPRSEYLDPGFTGDHVFVRALLDGLGRRGHEVRVASRLRPEDLSAGALPARALLTEARAVRAETARFDPDAWLVYGAGPAYPDLFGWRTRPKRYVLFAADAGDPDGASERWRPVLGRAHRRSLRQADAVTTYRPKRAGALAAAGVPADRLRVLPLAVRPWDVVPPREASRRRLGLPAEATVVLCVTRLSKPRGPGQKPWKTEMALEVLSAIARLPPGVMFVLAGDGRGRPGVESRAAELGLALGDRVRLAGAVDHDELVWYYAACDLFALPTLRDFPWLAVLEAQACGRPVVTTRAPSSELTVAAGWTGLLSGELTEFARDVARLAADPDLRQTLGRAGPAYVAAHHSIETRVGQVERLLSGEPPEG